MSVLFRYHHFLTINVAGYVGGNLQQVVQSVPSRKLLMMMPHAHSRNLLQGRGASYPGTAYYQVRNIDHRREVAALIISTSIILICGNFILHIPSWWLLCRVQTTMDNNPTLKRMSEYFICHGGVVQSEFFILSTHLHWGPCPIGMILPMLMIRANCWPAIFVGARLCEVEFTTIITTNFQ